MKYWKYWLCIISVIVLIAATWAIYRYVKTTPKNVRKAVQEGGLIIN